MNVRLGQCADELRDGERGLLLGQADVGEEASGERSEFLLVEVSPSASAEECSELACPETVLGSPRTPVGS